MSEETKAVEEELQSEEASETAPAEVSAEERLQIELAKEKDRALRIAAEYENFRKRSQKEREQLYVDAKSGVVAELLPVYDNFERALKQETADEAYYTGVQMIFTQLRETLAKIGVTEIECVGASFDPERHNAVFHIEDEAYGENEVVEELMKGFMIGEKVIRHSVVKVAN